MARYVSQNLKVNTDLMRKTTYRLLQLRTSPRRNPFGVNLTPRCSFRVDLVDVLWSINSQRMRYDGVSGGYAHLAAGSRTSSKAHFHQVPGDGHISERV